MKLVEELDYKVDIEDIKNCIREIVQHPIVIRMEGISVQHRKGVPSPWNIVDGLESLNLYNGAAEYEFNQIHERFINTEIEKIVKDFKLFRTRFMLKNCKTCYSFHTDNTWRLHVPIWTNKDCVFYFPKHGQRFHLEVGKIYNVNTTEMHTFINAGQSQRVHMVGCVE